MVAEIRESRLLRAVLLPLVILAWLLGHIIHTLLILILATVVAFALTPLVNLLVRWIPRILAIALAYLIGFALVFGLLSVVVLNAATEVTNLAHSLPRYAQDAQSL